MIAFLIRNVLFFRERMMSFFHANTSIQFDEALHQRKVAKSYLRRTNHTKRILSPHANVTMTILAAMGLSIFFPSP